MTDKELLKEWELKLEKAGLGMGTGHDEHVMKYGFSYNQLEDMHEETKAISWEAHKHQVHLYQQDLSRQRNASRTHKRSALRKAKQDLKARIWAPSGAQR